MAEEEGKSGPVPAAANKLEAQATGKADLSYSYWASGSSKTSGSSTAPKKLTDEEVEALRQQEAAREGSAHGASAWNHAGTFEERSVMEWAKQRLHTSLVGLQQGQVITTRVQALTGDAHIWFVRGKKRSGFELDLTLEWAVPRPSGDGAKGGSGGSAQADAGRVRGTVALAGLTPDELDELEAHANVAVTQQGAPGEAARASADARALVVGALREALHAFLAELRAL